MKTRTLLIAALMFVGLTAASFAQQATFSVGSTPVTAVIDTGQVELTGTVTFTLQSGVVATAGTITINYGVPITYPDLSLAAKTGPNGSDANISILPIASNVTVNNAASNNAAGLLVLTIPTTFAGTSFSVSGVRVAVANTGLPSLTASLSGVNVAITAGQTSVVVISSIKPGIAAVGTKSSTTGGPKPVVGSINAVSGSDIINPVITVQEGFLNAFGDPATKTNAGIKITLSAAPPAGVTIQFPATFSSFSGATAFAAWQAVNSDGSGPASGAKFTSTSTSLSAFYREASANDPTTAEFLSISPTLSVSSSATLPLPSTTVTYSVSLAPIGGVFNSDGTIIGDPLIPRYVEVSAGSATLFNITGLTTTLLVPFAQTVTALGYNTGLAISNTTEDPGSTAMGLTGATAQTGKITFYFFPSLPASGTNPTNPTALPTAAGFPGSGLDANGNLIAGSTYTVLLSQLLSQAGLPADFNGYVFIVTGFTNAHGFWTISNFTTFSQGGAMLVIPGARTTTPEGLNN